MQNLLLPAEFIFNSGGNYMGLKIEMLKSSQYIGLSVSCRQSLGSKKRSGDVTAPVASAFLFGKYLPNQTLSDACHRPLLQSTQVVTFCQNTHRMAVR